MDQSGMRSLGVSHHIGGKATRDMEDMDPGEPPDLTVASFHHPSIPPKGSLQLRYRFLRDLRRRPVLLWTAHSAAVVAVAAAAAPGVSPAPPGGESGACRLLGHPARRHCAPEKPSRGRRAAGQNRWAADSSPALRPTGWLWVPQAWEPASTGGRAASTPAEHAQGTVHGFAALPSCRSAALLAARALLSQ